MIGCVSLCGNPHIMLAVNCF